MRLDNYTALITGGASGIDACAREYARQNGQKLTEFLLNYQRYGRAAPLRRNLQIIDYADEVIAFWDGQSKGTEFMITQCRKRDKKIAVFLKKRKMK